MVRIGPDFMFGVPFRLVLVVLRRVNSESPSCPIVTFRNPGLLEKVTKRAGPLWVKSDILHQISIENAPLLTISLNSLLAGPILEIIELESMLTPLRSVNHVTLSPEMVRFNVESTPLRSLTREPLAFDDLLRSILEVSPINFKINFLWKSYEAN